MIDNDSNYDAAEDRELERLEDALTDDRRTTWIGVGVVIGSVAGAIVGILINNFTLGVVGGAAGGAVIAAGVGQLR